MCGSEAYLQLFAKLYRQALPKAIGKMQKKVFRSIPNQDTPYTYRRRVDCKPSNTKYTRVLGKTQDVSIIIINSSSLMKDR